MEQEPATTGGDGASAPSLLGDILSAPVMDAPSEPAGRPEPVAAPEPDAPSGDAPADPAATPRDERGRFAAKEQPGEAAAPPAVEQNATPQTVPVAAVMEERKKRQALEARLKELEARIAAPPAQDVPLGDLIFQDPERFVQAIRQPYEEQLIETRLALSERVARQNQDFPEAQAAFLAYVDENPQIKAQVAHALRTHPDPAGWAYEQGKALLEQRQVAELVQQHGGLEGIRAALAAAQQPAPAAPVAPSVPPPPASLAAARSSAPRGPAQAQRSASLLSEILGR